jgi:UDP-2,3-diacylglucosamine pyrophosphatase LpxH
MLVPMLSPPPGGRARARFRTIFLSDVHLGSPRAQAELLLDFLAHHQAEYLFLVGDIADDSESRPPSAWPAAHRAVLEALLGMARAGTRVCYTPGNHDPRSERVWGESIELEVVREHLHTTADGRRLWVVHGDAFDEDAQRRRWAADLGDGLARLLEHACAALEHVFLARRGRLGRLLREQCKHWLGYVARFERSAVRAARARAVDGVVCGHVHVPASRTIDGLYYGNGGDWVGSASALVEHADGRMELLSWSHAA